jgi:hypothetical protein
MEKAKFYAFDNEGETFDRYTIIDSQGDMIGLSENPNSPLGFNQYAGNCIDNYMFHAFGAAWRKHCDVKKIVKNELPRIINEFKTDGNIGKFIPFESLPIEIQTEAINRFN